MISEDTPTPSAKRRKVDHPKLVESLALSQNWNTTPNVISQRAEELLNRNPPQEDSRPLAIAEEKKVDVEDESSSEVDDVGLADFDTKGMSKEELKLWSRCAPMDQKLGSKPEDSPVRRSTPKVHFISMHPQTLYYLAILTANFPEKTRAIPRAWASQHR